MPATANDNGFEGELSQELIDQLSKGDVQTFRTLGLPADTTVESLMDAAMQAKLAPLVEKLAFTKAINEAWAVVALVTLVALIALPLARRPASHGSETTGKGRTVARH